MREFATHLRAQSYSNSICEFLYTLQHSTASVLSKTNILSLGIRTALQHKGGASVLNDIRILKTLLCIIRLGTYFGQSNGDAFVARRDQLTKHIARLVMQM